jgi:hypothetical protein
VNHQLDDTNIIFIMIFLSDGDLQLSKLLNNDQQLWTLVFPNHKNPKAEIWA